MMVKAVYALQTNRCLIIIEQIYKNQKVLQNKSNHKQI